MVILLNAVVLGLETYDSVEAAIGPALHLANDVTLGIFVVELLIRMAAHADRPASFWRSGWNVFDFVVITASFLPGVRENATLLRLVRLLRIVRAVRLLPDLRVLTVAVGRSVPGVASLAVITLLPSRSSSARCGPGAADDPRSPVVSFRPRERSAALL